MYFESTYSPFPSLRSFELENLKYATGRPPAPTPNLTFLAKLPWPSSRFGLFDIQLKSHKFYFKEATQ
jgi:hypothetical protein